MQKKGISVICRARTSFDNSVLVVSHGRNELVNAQINPEELGRSEYKSISL